MSRMDVLTNSEIDGLIQKSNLAAKYNDVVDRESAYEILNRKLSVEPREEPTKEKATKAAAAKKKDDNFLGKQVIKVLTSATFIRGAFGVLSKMLKK